MKPLHPEKIPESDNIWIGLWHRKYTGNDTKADNSESTDTVFGDADNIDTNIEDWLIDDSDNTDNTDIKTNDSVPKSPVSRLSFYFISSFYATR